MMSSCALFHLSTIANKLNLYLRNLKKQKVIVIQAIWRGAIIRKRFKASKNAIKQLNTALLSGDLTCIEEALAIALELVYPNILLVFVLYLCQ